MMGYGYDIGAGGWIAMTIFWVGLITLVVWALYRVAVATRGDTDRDSAEATLDRRFAAGELDEDAYESMRSTLHASRIPRTDRR